MLPQQLRTVLAGLQALRFLTVSHYDRAGGAAGLEALYVEREIRSAARKTGLSETAVRKLLLTMVESEAQAKTVVKTLPELETAIAGESIRAASTERGEAKTALEELCKTELVRERTDPDTRQRAWLLDHDYLARPVVEAERRANRWQTILEEGARGFEEAGESLVRRWRALLTTGAQVQLLAVRFRRNFHYGEHRSYALWSTLRFSPVVLVLVLGGFAWIEYEQWRAVDLARSKASQILVSLGELRDEALAENQIDALWDLATAEEDVRDQFLGQMLASEHHATRFARHPAPIARALAGLDADRRARIRERLTSYVPTEDARTSRAVGLIAFELSSMDVLEPTYLPEFFHAEDIPLVASKLRPEQAERAVELVLAAMQGTTNPYALRALGEGLTALGTKLPLELALRASRAAQAVVAWNGDQAVVETYSGA